MLKTVPSVFESTVNKFKYRSSLKYKQSTEKRSPPKYPTLNDAQFYWPFILAEQRAVCVSSYFVVYPGQTGCSRTDVWSRKRGINGFLVLFTSEVSSSVRPCMVISNVECALHHHDLEISKESFFVTAKRTHTLTKVTTWHGKKKIKRNNRSLGKHQVKQKYSEKAWEQTEWATFLFEAINRNSIWPCI